MGDVNGDTAVKLIYAFARGQSILRKAKNDFGVDASKLQYGGQWKGKSEFQLAFELVQFQDVIIQVLKDLSPHGLCSYLRNLVKLFTDFYSNCPVMKAGVSEAV